MHHNILSVILKYFGGIKSTVYYHILKRKNCRHCQDFTFPLGREMRFLLSQEVCERKLDSSQNERLKWCWWNVNGQHAPQLQLLLKCVLFLILFSFQLWKDNNLQDFFCKLAKQLSLFSVGYTFLISVKYKSLIWELMVRYSKSRIHSSFSL